MRTLLCLMVLTCSLSAANRSLSFRHDVLPVLSKAGCNGGGCHGALAGKGGFRLSLNAYDPATDHYNITRELRGRRVEFCECGGALRSALAASGQVLFGGFSFESGRCFGGV